MDHYFVLMDHNEAELAAGIVELSDLAACYHDGELRTFASKSAAQNYMKEERMKGRVIKLKSERSYSLK